MTLIVAFDFFKESDWMNPIFAHHDMLDSLDFLHLHPVTPGAHALALLVYALLLIGAPLGLASLGRLLRKAKSRYGEASS